MKIAYYCQHVLGIGHFHRSLEICKALDLGHEVTLIIGGPDVHEVPQSIKLVRLPGLQMDRNFQNLSPCEPGASLEDVQRRRRNQLFDYFTENRPDVFLVELYPFGRKAFRFELDPVLHGVKDGTLPPCASYVSLRDILVERPNDKSKFEDRVIKVLNSSFDGLLIHADEDIVRLEETFSRFDDITIPHAYTGFVTPQPSACSRKEIRQLNGLTDTDKLIVVSIGGGSVGNELIEACLASFHLLRDHHHLHMQIFTGPYFPQPCFERLQGNLPQRARLDRFTADFPGWLQAADLSISMAGYNTCMNIVQAGIPALVYPFAQNQEQTFRARRLQKKAPLEIIDQTMLMPEPLADRICAGTSMPRYPTMIKLDGATRTRQQIEQWQQSK